MEHVLAGNQHCRKQLLTIQQPLLMDILKGRITRAPPVTPPLPSHQTSALLLKIYQPLETQDLTMGKKLPARRNANTPS